MTGFPEGKSFMKYFDIWIDTPSDPCPLGGKAPYASAIDYNETAVVSSTFRSAHHPLRSQKDFIEAYQDAERITQSMKGLDVFAYSPFYVFFVQYDTIISLTLKLLAFSLSVIFVISCLFLGSVKTSLVLAVTILMIMVDIGAFLVLFGISLNAVSLVNLIICVGLAVEFCVHIVRAFTVVPNVIKNDRDSRVKHAMNTVGSSVFSGITLTKFIGVCVLAFTESKIFQIFYFRMWFSLIIISCLHAFLFLPVALGLFGGKSYADGESVLDS